jgi:hypothetical protein
MHAKVLDAIRPLVKGKQVASMKTRRLIAMGAFALAAAAAPAYALMTTATPVDFQAYPGECLAWFGNQEDGKCLSYSNGQPINAVAPNFSYGGSDCNGVCVNTGPLAPGTTIDQQVN